MKQNTLKNLADAIGPSTIMCSGILPDGDDCDTPATHQLWIGRDEDEWVEVCDSCAKIAQKNGRRVEKMK